MTPAAYIAIAQIWVSDTETIPIPVLGVFATPEAARDNALAVLLRTLTTDAPHLLDKPVTVVPCALPDESVRAFLATLRATRPDLLPTPRGKPR